MNGSYKIQRLCAWAAPISMIIFFIGFAVAKILVPPSPTRSAAETAQWYLENANTLRAGLLITCVAGGMYVLFCAQLTVQMMRVEGRHAPLALFQLAMGACALIEFVYPLYFWLAAAYRPHPPEIVQTLNDMGWLPFDGFIWSIIWQYIAVGVVVFMDKRENPIFPRWYGYLSFWTFLLSLPACLNVFFKEGPLAWNGALAWWVLVSVIFIWNIATAKVLLDAINRQEAEERAEPSMFADSNEQLARRLAILEARLEAGSGSRS